MCKKTVLLTTILILLAVAQIGHSKEKNKYFPNGWKVNVVNVRVEKSTEYGKGAEIQSILTTDLMRENLPALVNPDLNLFQKVAMGNDDLLIHTSLNQYWPLCAISDLYPITGDYYLIESLCLDDFAHSMSLINLNTPEVIYTTWFGNFAGGNIESQLWKKNRVLGIERPLEFAEPKYFYFPPEKDSKPVIYKNESVGKLLGVKVDDSEYADGLDKVWILRLEEDGVRLLCISQCANIRSYNRTYTCDEGDTESIFEQHLLPWEKLLGEGYDFSVEAPKSRCPGKKTSPDGNFVLDCESNERLQFSVKDGKGRSLIERWQIENAGFHAGGIWLLIDVYDEFDRTLKFFYGSYADISKKRITEIRLPKEYQPERLTVSSIQEIGDDELLLSSSDALIRLSLKDMKAEAFLFRKKPKETGKEEFIKRLLDAAPAELNRKCLKKIFSKDLDAYLEAEEKPGGFENPSGSRNIFKYFDFDIFSNEYSASNFYGILTACGADRLPKDFWPDDYDNTTIDQLSAAPVLFRSLYSWRSEWLLFRMPMENAWTGAWHTKPGEYYISEFLFQNRNEVERIIRVRLPLDPFEDRQSHWKND